MNPKDVIKNSLQAGIDAQSWPKILADYKARLAESGDSFKQTHGAMAFRLYFKMAASMGESSELRESLYAALLGEMMAAEMKTEIMDKQQMTLNEFGKWMVDTCKELGCTTDASYAVAHVFVESLASAREVRDPKYRVIWLDADSVGEMGEDEK